MQSQSVSNKILLKILNSNLRVLRRKNRVWEPRRWSNNELAKFSEFFDGSVLNCSAWEDKDKEGRTYREYFTNSSSYWISNKGGERGESHCKNEIFLDLEDPKAWQGVGQSFQVVLNHTVLEHVFEMETAVANLSRLTNDILITVVPFMQIEHWQEGSYGDYWRFTEHSLISLFKNEGLSPVYISSNHNPVFPIYYFFVASKNPKLWKNKFLKYSPNNLLGSEKRTHISTKSIGNMDLMR